MAVRIRSRVERQMRAVRRAERIARRKAVCVPRHDAAKTVQNGLRDAFGNGLEFGHSARVYRASEGI